MKVWLVGGMVCMTAVFSLQRLFTINPSVASLCDRTAIVGRLSSTINVASLNLHCLHCTLIHHFSCWSLDF
jgi:hypothetical protein